MQRFILFGFDMYEAYGGSRDILCSSRALGPLIARIRKDNTSHYYEIFDCTKRKFIHVPGYTRDLST